LLGKPEKIVSLSQPVHDELMLLASKYEFFQLSRIGNFYSDVIFENEHISLLDSELKILNKDTASKELRTFLDGTLKLTEYAFLYHRQIEAVAD
jgi:hypothetical protein